jgi:hypothetical protein
MSKLSPTLELRPKTLLLYVTRFIMHRWLQISDLYQSKNQRDSLLEKDSKGDDEKDD